jgi:hypothetical protein
MAAKRRRRRPNPVIGARGSRRRVWVAVAGFAALALVLALVGLVGHDPVWLRTALLIGVVSAVWGVYAAVVRP